MLTFSLLCHLYVSAKYMQSGKDVRKQTVKNMSSQVRLGWKNTKKRWEKVIFKFYFTQKLCSQRRTSVLILYVSIRFVWISLTEYLLVGVTLLPSKTLQSCPADMSRLTCQGDLTRWPLMADLSTLTCPGWPVLGDLSMVNYLFATTPDGPWN
jgi:hypothetical protein